MCMGHVKEIDGIRAIAVMAVVFFHAGRTGPLSGGFLGVDIFFVLSGFLITWGLAAEYARNGQIALGRFYMRRLIRLSPPLLFLLATYLAVAWFVWPEYGAWAHLRDAAVSTLYLADYGYAFWDVPEYLRHCWSLAVEEHFYLIWPLVLPFALKARNPARVLLVAYLVASAWRIGNFALLDWQQAYYRFDTRFAGILLGGWLGLRLGQGRDLVPPRLIGVLPYLALATIALAMVASEWKTGMAWLVSIPVIEVATAALICGVVCERRKSATLVMRALGSAPMVRLGMLSYGIYLWHFSVSTLTRNAMPYWQSLAITATVGIVMAWISYETIERPGRLHRERNRPQAPDLVTAAT